MCTIHDFDYFCAAHQIKVTERLVMSDGEVINFLPNALGSLAMYRLGKL
jgi:hypothetical protein